MFKNPEIVFGGTCQLLSLVELIYSAVGNPELWEQVLERIAMAAGGESTALFTRFPKDSVVALTRFEPGSWEQYVTYYSGVNILAERCDAMYPDGTVRYSHRVIENREFENSEFYVDFFKRYNMHHSFGIKVPLGDGLPPAYLSSQRPKSKGPFDEQQGFILQTLLPHLRRALQLHLKFSQMDARAQGYETALAAYGHAVLGLNQEGRITFLNRQADELLRAADGIRLEKGKLVAASPAQDKALQQLLSGALGILPESCIPSGGSMRINSQSEKSPLTVTVSPFSGTLPGSRYSVAALVFLSHADKKPQPRSAVMRAVYHLTPTEARIADLLLQGLDIRQVAEFAGITVETCRFHVKSILAKTGVRRQSELIRLLLSLPDIPI